MTPPDVTQVTPFTIGKVFTFLFLTLGPLKIIGPFASMTRGRDGRFKRRLAFQGILIAAFALFVAATVGAMALERWGISIGALELTAGVVLFLVALQPVLAQYDSHDSQPATPDSDGAPPSVSSMAFTPLAFPTIVTPYGIAILIMLVALRADDPAIAPRLLGVTAAVLVLDLLAMLGAERILKTPFVKPLLGIVGAVVGVLQVALGVQAIVAGLRLLGIVSAGPG